MGERDDDVELLAQQAAELVLGLGESARSKRRPLCVEAEVLALRQRTELRGSTDVDRREPFLGPHRPHFVELPHDVGRGAERWHEVVRHPSDSTVVLRRPEVRLDALSAAFGRRIDDGLVDLPERPLREG